jgi:hypothetical protein
VNLAGRAEGTRPGQSGSLDGGSDEISNAVGIQKVTVDPFHDPERDGVAVVTGEYF